MTAVPGDLNTDQQPPMILPLRHFFVALGFLLAGVLAGVWVALGEGSGTERLAHVHLLLAGWVCLTILGAMTQFVPVWSGTTLHSRRLATAQLVLVTLGLAGFAVAATLGAFPWLLGFGLVMLAGFWVFVYNVGRTLLSVRGYDMTERHFLVALAFFLVLTALGALLALNLVRPALSSLPVTHGGLRGAHVTVAVFGAVLTTIYGALYQLGTMFTQTELHGIDHRLQPVEEVAHPAGVALLAVGRLADVGPVARVGAVCILVAALAFAVVLGRKLVEMQVEWTPMHSRYTVVVVALAGWALLSLPAWVSAPTGTDTLFGAPGTVHLLVLGTVGFVILGTLYHIVPFIVWVHQYSDRLGFEDVPMIDDLYDSRLAAADFALVLGGTGLLVAADIAVADTRLTALGGLLVLAGVVVFLANMALVVRRHSPHSVDQVLLGRVTPRGDDEDARGERDGAAEERTANLEQPP